MSGKSWAVWIARDDEVSATAASRMVASLRMAQSAAGVRGGNVEVVLVEAPRPDGTGRPTRVPAWAKECLGDSVVSRFWRLEHPLLALGTPGATATVLAAAVEHSEGVHTLCLGHDYDAVDLCGLLGRRLGAAVVTAVSEIRGGANDLRVIRPVHGGRFLAELRVPPDAMLVLTVPRSVATSSRQPVQIADDNRCEVATLEVEATLSRSLPDREVLAIEEPDSPPELTTAERIVAVGRGLGGPEHLGLARQLATALGAEIAGSRPVVDSGWLPADRQVGSSGQTVTPTLYVALGISGAAQHLEGMSGSRCVVAINRDPEAPIFRSARYGIVGDLHTVVPALIAALTEDQAEPN